MKMGLLNFFVKLTGFLLRKIIDDMQASINKKLTRKISLYSAHEMNVAYLLNALEVYFPHVPPYGANVLVELHEKNRMYCVKVLVIILLEY